MSKSFQTLRFAVVLSLFGLVLGTTFPYCRCKSNYCQLKYDQSSEGKPLCVLPTRTRCPTFYTQCVDSFMYKWKLSPSQPSPGAQVNVSVDIQSFDFQHQFLKRNFTNEWAQETKWWIVFALPEGWNEMSLKGFEVVLDGMGMQSPTPYAAKKCKDLRPKYQALLKCGELSKFRFIFTENYFIGHSREISMKKALPVTLTMNNQFALPRYAVSSVAIPLWIYYADSKSETLVKEIKSFQVAEMNIPQIEPASISNGIFWINGHKKSAVINFRRNYESIQVGHPYRIVLQIQQLDPDFNSSIHFDEDSIQSPRSPVSSCFDNFKYVLMNETSLSIEMTFSDECKAHELTDFELPLSVSLTGPVANSSMEIFQKFPSDFFFFQGYNGDKLVETSFFETFLHRDRQGLSGQISIFSVISLSIYTMATLAAILITRTYGITFSSNSFWTDLTSLFVLFIFGISTISNIIWIFLASRDKDPSFAGIVYFTFESLKYCFVWTMMLSASYQWCCALSVSVRKIPRWQLLLSFFLLNVGFYIFILIHIYRGMEVFKCVYNNIMMVQPKYPDIAIQSPCKGYLCPDLQPAEWNEALNSQTCMDMDYRNSFSEVFVTTVVLLLCCTLALFCLGILVLKRGSNLLLKSSNTNTEVLRTIRRSLLLYLLVIFVISMTYIIGWILYVSCYKTKTFLPAIIWYIFAVWLPTLLPAGGLLFLHWNHRLNHLKCTPATVGFERIEHTQEMDKNESSSATLTNDEITSNLYSNSLLTVSLNLFLPEPIENACFIVLYASTKLPGEENNSSLSRRRPIRDSWVRVSTTESVVPSPSERDCSNNFSHVISFFSVLQIPLNSSYSDLCLRFVACELNEEEVASPSARAKPLSTELARRARIAGISSVELPVSKCKVICEFTTSALNVMISAETHTTMKLVGFNGSHRSDRESSSAHGCSFSIQSNVSGSSLSRYTLGNPPPQLSVRAVMISNRMDENHGQSISRSFQFGSDSTLVVEDLTESPFSNDIPRQYIEILIRERTKMANDAKLELSSYQGIKSSFVSNNGGFYEALIDRIQDEVYSSSLRSWLEKRLSSRWDYVNILRANHRESVDREKRGILFKGTMEKKNPLLQFLPLNLHIQDMWVGSSRSLTSQKSRRTSRDVSVYDTVSVGALAGHCLKFKYGGILGLRYRIEKLNSEIPLCEKTSKFCWKEEQLKLDDLQWQLQKRKDICFSQALATLVTSFCRKIDLALQHFDSNIGVGILNQLTALGFLFHVECLLSTHGKEVGMLEDCAPTISDLATVHFVVRETLEASTLRMPTRNLGLPGVISCKLSMQEATDPFQLIVSVNVRCGQTKLPSSLRNGSPISVVPVIFTQGINEMQTIANNTGSKKTELQDMVNSTNIKTLRSYCERYIRFSAAVSQPLMLRADEVLHRLRALEAAIELASTQLVKSKHPEILAMSSSLCRDLGGARVTSCKSANDRTAMSITLEQGTLLEKYHHLHHHYLTRTVTTMRSKGVRLENISKNIGKRQYSCNSFQRAMLPEEYRCPEGTYRSANSS